MQRHLDLSSRRTAAFASGSGPLEWWPVASGSKPTARVQSDRRGPRLTLRGPDKRWVRPRLFLGGKERSFVGIEPRLGQPDLAWRQWTRTRWDSMMTNRRR